MALGLIAPQVDVSLLMPSISQQSRSGGGDVSLQDSEVNATTSMYSMPGMFLLFILVYTPTSLLSVLVV